MSDLSGQKRHQSQLAARFREEPRGTNGGAVARRDVGHEVQKEFNGKSTAQPQRQFALTDGRIPQQLEFSTAKPLDGAATASVS
ncbi:hypothetical protein A1O3_00092 [Capronia epimyces CBS 606.96]|uniref:Uncharacterized protein n=1 Tax=Capronia epimyces CBS 606.96 TaxID=1182542 RepID=W9ZAJ9_9EURO|nr:uncharacterized protein A1O3_00092 [Capronia epimyces CBS 606.96]EXJ91544.1 hypothetical protein A1O3_00092 [Capronia epimyces CBS 606.96]